jgi:signal transduction histidine kinase
VSTPHRDLRALSERVEQMREEERARIARELHDELGQLLTGIKLDFSSTIRKLREIRPQGDIVDRLQSAMGQVDIAIAMVRRIATDLRPAALDHHDLGSAVEDEARRVAARSGMRIRLANRVSGQVEPEVATATFRIFQEAMTNAVRHAGASAINARVRTARGRLTLHVYDDGAGIPRGRGPGGGSLGLLGMYERARSAGGELRIRSRSGRGTLIVLVVPLGS